MASTVQSNRVLWIGVDDHQGDTSSVAILFSESLEFFFETVRSDVVGVSNSDLLLFIILFISCHCLQEKWQQQGERTQVHGLEKKDLG